MRQTPRVLVHVRRLATSREAIGDALQAAYRVALGVDSSSDAIHITPSQIRAVASARAGHSVFLHLPTGAGKSLAFQVPALLAPIHATTVVVSPLLALMHDQVANLKRKGIDAVFVSADTSRQRNDLSLNDQLQRKRLVYTTPEFLVHNSEMRAWITSLHTQQALERLVIDEAHCVLEWGNSFRPSYLELCRWKARVCPDVPVTLATATVVEEDIPRLAELFHATIVCDADAVDPRSHHQTQLASRMVLVQDMSDRANLRIEVVSKPAEHAATLIYRRVGNTTAAIVYCLTRDECERVCLQLIRLGCSAAVYHGGLARRRREYVQKQWMSGHISVMCATSAFGMGIDRPDVRWVVHHSLPMSLSAYFQQIGRAGRDGQPANCLLLYSSADKVRVHAITTERVDEHDGTILSSGHSARDVEAVAAFCTSTECRRDFLTKYFGHGRVQSQCARNCNCGPLVEPQIERDNGEGLALMQASDSSLDLDLDHDEAFEVEPSTVNIEIHYQRVLAYAKQVGLPKRETLSRRTIRDILRSEPTDVETLASIRGVGSERAEKYFHLFRFR